MSFKNVARALVATAALAAAGAATAATFTFQFTGTVTYGAGVSVPVGTPITGSYSYDAKTEPAIHFKGSSSYQIPAPHIISATVAGHTITTERLTVTVVNNFKGNIEDSLTVMGESMVLDGTTFPEGVFGFVLSSAPLHRDVLKGTKLPRKVDVPAFDAYESLSYGVLQINGGQEGTLLQFKVDSITAVKEVP
ncbi:hypothetical protein [Rhizobacter sp. P5_C2]